MYKVIVAVIALVVASQALMIGAPRAHALSCVPLDMYLEHVVAEASGETLVFIGTASEVTKDHTQVVKVSKALKGWVAPELWVEHAYDDTWQYFCSNGPAKAGKSTIFMVTIDDYGSFKAVQTLDADSADAKKFIASLEKADHDAGITEVKADDRAAEVRGSIQSLFAAIMDLLRELRYWESR